MKGPILCFVGPPGVGKTSLGQSIARAMSRKFVRISLGGVRDEAEIRGHRRTYIGSIPGRIVQALKQAGSMNPVFMLDEIDKVAGGLPGRSGGGAARGARPGAEPLVPRPLPRDSGRPVAGALHRHVEPARDGSSGAARSHGDHPARRLQRGGEGPHRAPVPAAAADDRSTACRRTSMEITDAALRLVIGEYTREAGVRNLERQLGTHCAEGGGADRHASRRRRVRRRKRSSIATRWTTIWGRRGSGRRWRSAPRGPGVATGLAWTETGGDVLFIEATLLPGGNQNIILTGQLGNVMQESARAALSHIRARAEELGISPDFLAKHDLHVHVPGGRHPEGRPVGWRDDGDGDPVGGAEPAGAAGRRHDRRNHAQRPGAARRRHPGEGRWRRGGSASRRSILPALNEPDLAELPEEVRRDMTFVPVETLEQVIEGRTSTRTKQL